MSDLEFFVAGKPQQQGSKTPWGADANDANLKPWRGAVASACHDLMVEKGYTKPYDGPCRLDVSFVYDRPKGHFKSDGTVRESAPKHKTSAPDRDKLLRSIGDALTGTAWKDDSRVVSGWTEKVYGEFAGAHIEITFLES